MFFNPVFINVTKQYFKTSVLNRKLGYNFTSVH